MQRFVWALAALVLLPALGGCFQSAKELISAADGQFPFTKLTYAATGEEAGDTITMVRDGDSYVDEADPTAPRLRIREVRDDLWLVQAHFDLEGDVFYAYALAKGSLDNEGAELFASDVEKTGLDRAALTERGFVACEIIEEAACFDTLDPYLKLALERVDAGGEPDKTFTILSHE